MPNRPWMPAGRDVLITGGLLLLNTLIMLTMRSDARTWPLIGCGLLLILFLACLALWMLPKRQPPSA